MSRRGRAGRAVCREEEAGETGGGVRMNGALQADSCHALMKEL